VRPFLGPTMLQKQRGFGRTGLGPRDSPVPRRSAV
jgi:hypothetical protein